MKRKYIKLCAIGFVLCLISFSFFAAAGCGPEIPGYKFKETTYRDADNNLVYSQMAETERGEYHFPRSGKTGSLSKEGQEKFIYYAEQIHRHLKLKQKVTVYLNPNQQTAAVSAANKIYVSNRQDALSIEMISLYLQLVYGESANYGVTYGLACEIFKEMRWGTVSIPKSQDEIKEFLTDENNRYILDLNYGVFNSSFSDNNTIEYAKSIALRLSDHIVKTHGREAIEGLLSAAAVVDTNFDIKYHEYLNEWLAEIGADFKHDFNGVSMRFFSNNWEYPIGFITKYYTVYIRYDFEDEPAHPILPDYYNGEISYYFLKEYLKEQEAVLTNIKGFFDYDGGLRPKMYLNNKGVGADFSKRAAESGSIFSIDYYYAGIILAEKYGVNANGLAAGIMLHCMYQYSGWYVKNEQYYFENRELNTEENRKNYDEYDKYFGKDAGYSLRNFTYFVAFLNWREEQFYLGYSRVSYSVVYYILEKYGKNKLFDCHINGFTAAFDKSQQQFLDEFAAFLNTIFW